MAKTGQCLDKIEISPAMLDAATSDLSLWDDRFGTLRDAAQEVLEAAFLAYSESKQS